jgi:hypothetical protein
MYILLPLLVLSLGFGQELLTNGDFEQELSVGWVHDTGGYGYVTWNRGTGYQPDPDYEFMDSLYSGSGFSRLRQVVDAPGVVLELSFWAAFGIGGTSSTCWPVSGVNVEYYDASDVLLGQTRFYYHNEYCTWTPSGTLSLIEVTNPDWTQYSLNIAEELNQNLPGVNPGDVAKIGIALVDTTAGG